MKSPEVYRTLRIALAPEFKAAGFNRAKGLLSWAHRRGERYLVVWCQVSQSGWDSYAGSKFTVELQLSSEPVVGARAVHRQRLATMLNGIEREELRSIQNGIIDSLEQPPASYPLLHISAAVRIHYLKLFERIEEPYGERDDVWLRYKNRQHVAEWAQFIIRILPGCFRSAQAWG
jgi:hypothetical protein